ncbi:hypothetical protein CYMTET_15196 [Cymbomonas tetramitiformis]|uniref:Uncharacterized protein n=1 Tax=Cymbomonas tetramitiformis TaxID=36881 RepID=A0AAE0GET0_9CHLO|nr:hypothetical protein CYMTET_15196 [Cymbomonas tetramitiformis]
MDSLPDDSLTQRIAELRATDAGKSLLEKVATGSNEDFTPAEISLNNRLSLFLAEQERRQTRAQYAAHIAGPGAADSAVHAKLDELLSAHGPARRKLPGSECDFRDKNGNDSNAAKRTWEFANKADEIFFNSSRSGGEGSAGRSGFDRGGSEGEPRQSEGPARGRYEVVRVACPSCLYCF